MIQVQSRSQPETGLIPRSPVTAGLDQTWSETPISVSDFNILFTCAGRRVALLDAFRTAMGNLDVDGRLFATDITWASPAFQLADVGLIVPPARRIEYIPKLLDYVKEHGIKLLIPVTDLDLRSLARHRDKFSDFGCAVMVGSEASVMLCRNKAQTSHLLLDSGVPFVKTLTIREFQSQPFYPCFVKPSHGSAGVGSSLINNEKELKRHIHMFRSPLIVQEYIPGQEFTIDVYRDRSGKVRCVVPRQRLVVRSGEVEQGLTVKDPDLIDATIRAAALLGDIWGVFCCQCRRHEPSATPQFFEINPRFGGGTPLSIAAGADLPRYLLEEVLGRPITAEIGRFEENLLMLRYDDAAYLPANNIESLPAYLTPEFR